MGTPAVSNTRRIVVHHYPYSIFYRASAETLRVLAVAHQSRRPDYWVERSRYRGETPLGNLIQ